MAPAASTSTTHLARSRLEVGQLLDDQLVERGEGSADDGAHDAGHVRPAAGGRLGAMRFAIKTAPQNTTYADMLDVWQAADELPVFESAWTFDHFEPIFSDRTGPCLEGWLTTTALAQATSRIRVGVLVTGMPYRHPSVLANMAATLDVISDGRLELGLGAGWNQDESDALGIDLPPLKERFDRFDEGVEVIRLLLTQEVSDFDGRYFTAAPGPVRAEARAAAPPADRHRRHRARTARCASVARFADHWNHPGDSIDGWRRVPRGPPPALRRDRPRPVDDHDVDPRPRRLVRADAARRRVRGVGRRRPRPRHPLPAARRTPPSTSPPSPRRSRPLAAGT